MPDAARRCAVVVSVAVSESAITTARSLHNAAAALRAAAQPRAMVELSVTGVRSGAGCGRRGHRAAGERAAGGRPAPGGRQGGRAAGARWWALGDGQTSAGRIRPRLRHCSSFEPFRSAERTSATWQRDGFLAQVCP